MISIIIKKNLHSTISDDHDDDDDDCDVRE